MKWFLRVVAVIFVLAHGMTTPVGAATQDFRFSSFNADYYLDADKEGRSTLKTIETLVAEFPSTDQNHGIERAIPKTYDNHPTSLRLESVKDGSGKDLSYETYDSNGNEVLRIGDKDNFVHGSKTYVITYFQRDVTKYFTNTASTEFYWNTNGLQWSQPFGSVSATVHLSDSIKPTFTQKLACYQGDAGSKSPCSISTDGRTVVASATTIGPHQNMTIALGFTAGTFRGYEPSVWDRIVSVWAVLFVVTSIVGFVALLWISLRYGRVSNRASELNPIPAEYIPPKGTSVLTAAQIGKGTKAESTAGLIDLAVRHYITITETRAKSWLRAARYQLEIVKPVDDLTPEEKDFVTIMFGSVSVGTKLDTKSFENNSSLHTKLQKAAKELKNRIKGEYGLRQKDEAKAKPFKITGIILGVLSVITLSPVLIIAAIVAYVCGSTLRPLTDSGLELLRYMEGLKKYIGAAEQERIKMLQSPEGAEKTGVTVEGDADAKLVRLYERTLPYAVLFGQEKEWSKQLGNLYEKNDGTPDWYIGHGAFNAAVFTTAMNDFSSSMNSYGASSSSSTGGSTGGGSSGGGGGGGGGGGW